MMTSIFLMILLSFDFNSDIKQVVQEYHQLETEASEVSFIHKYHGRQEASVQAYVTSIAMKQAEYSPNPLRKLQLFQENKTILNDLIDTHPSNIHLRYVRLLSQENTPDFLGYNEYIEEDKLILKNILDVEDETDYLDYFIRANTSL